ncbi:hypothetical protein LIER_32291 [Lithospermum erythrorhizon]|uniref:Uncharacterized protein n=1 Tax=Lithospermum erythrorhizon TaxID=34254 RepID=A0AAV3RV85_LITER
MSMVKDLVMINGLPWKHYCAAIRMNGENIEEYVDDCYTVITHKQVYNHSIMPMSRPNLWPQPRRVRPLPPPIVQRRAGRIKKLRRVNPIEAEDNEKKVCKVRKYLYKTSKELGHNSHICKKKPTNDNVQPDQQELMEETYNNLSQTSVHSSQAPPLKIKISQRSMSHAGIPTRNLNSGIFIRSLSPMDGPFMEQLPFKARNDKTSQCVLSSKFLDA